MLISVIVPVYNAGRFLGGAVESVLGQTHGDIELILVNDGSTDGSEAVCREYARADKRVRVISRANGGPAAARNTGVRGAAGEFVFFLDADDYIDKDALEILAAGCAAGRPDMVMSNFRKLENDGSLIEQSVTFTPDGTPCSDATRELLTADAVGYVRHFLKHPSNHPVSYCWARLYRLSIIREHNIAANERMRLFEDFVFNLEYMRHTGRILFINRSLYIYTMHNSHVSASMAVVNSDSLLHDMGVFREKAGEFLRDPAIGAMDAAEVEKEVGHALVHYVIIFLVRSCRRVTAENREKIRFEINKLLEAPILRESLRHYSPSAGNSRILPVLMKHRLLSPLMLLCGYKARRRYGKPGAR